jgi:Spy/CpxP family protein refolding chaperone
MTNARIVLALAVALLITCPALAAPEKSMGKKATSCPAAERVDNMVQGLTLTDAQKASLDSVKKDLAPKLAAAAKNMHVLTPEQKKARAAARAAGKTGEEIDQAVDAAVKLSDEQKAKLAAAKKQISALHKELRQKVLAVLTPEQQKQLKKGNSSAQAIDFGTLRAAKVNAATSEVMKVSNEGFVAMRAIRAARIAIFYGEPKVAVEILGKAKEALDAASKDEAMVISDMKTTGGAKAAHAKTLAGDKTAHQKTTAAAMKAMKWIPIDGQISLADTYVPTPEKTKHVAQANEHLKNSRAKEAVEELRLGNIDVTYTYVMMPLTATTQCLADAMQLAKEHKYYEANLALKAAEDGVIVNSVSLVDTVDYKRAPKDHAKKSSQSEKHEKQDK